MSDTPRIFYRYHFIFDDNRKVIFEIDLDPETLDYIPISDDPNPDWSRLDYHPCDHCGELDKNITYCPVAANIAPIVEAFKETFSYDIADVTVETNERVYSKKQVPIQHALSSLLGLVMPTSGCKDLDKLRPLVKYHLPFASIEETIFRAASMYLLGQYFRRKYGEKPDWDMYDLVEIYHNIDRINRNLVKRLQSATNKDASLNAVVILDTFAQMFPMSIEETLSSFENIFSSYID